VRIWLRRERLTAVRRSILRTAFLADLVFAMDFPQTDRGLHQGNGAILQKRLISVRACAKRGLMTAKARL
jgi:hypothetical protein